MSLREAFVDGGVGPVHASGGRVYRVLQFRFERGRIVQIEVVADPARLRRIELAVFND